MAPLFAQLLFRLRKDFRLSIISMFGAIGVLAILPFSLVRFAQGNPLAGSVDLLVALGITAPAIYAWRGGSLDHAGLWIAVNNTVGSLAITALLGKTGLYWLFPALLSNFFVVSPLKAAILALIGIGGVQGFAAAFDSPVQRISVATTQFLVALFAYIFAKRTALQRQMLEEMATLDPLTGARNRRAMEEEVSIALKAHARSGRPVALMVLDLDHFKRINDRFGHGEGDRVLRAFADLVRRSSRCTDRLFRYGGEEFVLLMEHTDEIAVERAFANLRRRVHAELRARGEPVTVSAGAAVLRHGEGRDAWFARADAALYRAKQGGRDRLVVDQPPPTDSAG